jgi:hypothetical protein
MAYIKRQRARNTQPAKTAGLGSEGTRSLERDSTAHRAQHKVLADAVELIGVQGTFHTLAQDEKA